MDNKESNKIEPNTQKSDSFDKLLSAFEGLNNRLSGMEEKLNKVSSRPTQDELKLYEDHPRSLDVNIIDKPKTYGEIYEEAKSLMVQERKNFLSNQMLGERRTSAYAYGDNARHFQECAFLEVYEKQGPIFKQYYREEYELLKSGDYKGILNKILVDNREMERFLKGDEMVHANNSATILTALARDLIYSRQSQ